MFESMMQKCIEKRKRRGKYEKEVKRHGGQNEVLACSEPELSVRKVE